MAAFEGKESEGAKVQLRDALNAVGFKGGRKISPKQKHN